MTNLKMCISPKPASATGWGRRWTRGGTSMRFDLRFVKSAGRHEMPTIPHGPGNKLSKICKAGMVHI